MLMSNADDSDEKKESLETKAVPMQVAVCMVNRQCAGHTG